jgi:hypothetical protein
LTRLQVSRIDSIEVLDTLSAIDIDVEITSTDRARLILVYERAVDIRVGRIVSELMFHEHDPSRRGSTRISEAVHRRLVATADRYV